MYLGRALQWESKLSKDMQSLLIPWKPADAKDPSKTVSTGTYRGFPHYTTSGADINFEKANILSDLTGWVVKQNAELFRSILS